MEGESIYGVDLPTRALAAQGAADDETSLFLLGTASIQAEKNQVQQLAFRPEEGSLSAAAFPFPDGEILHLAAAASAPTLVACCYSQLLDGNTRQSPAACLLKVPNTGAASAAGGDGGDGAAGALGAGILRPAPERLALPDCHATRAAFAPNNTRLLTLEGDAVCLWDVQGSAAKRTSGDVAGLRGERLQGGGAAALHTCAWSPHHGSHTAAVGVGADIVGVDLRANTTAYCLPQAHDFCVRGIDFNPNKQYLLVSCGHDGKIRFWDTRSQSGPLKTLALHSHFATSVAYNPFHDQLLLSSGTDAKVNLFHESSLSSGDIYSAADDSALQGSDDEGGDGVEDGEHKLADGEVIAALEEDDAVYAAVWSAAEPWVYSSLSIDGRLHVQHVPREVKFQILL